jgi:ABC-2 type transport system permease protein
MRSYLAAFRSGISGLMEYRIDFISNSTLSLIITAIVQIMMWQAIYASSPAGTSIGGMEQGQMISYLLFASLCSVLTRSGRIERGASDEIRNGDLNKYLLKPISHLGFSFALSSAEKAGSLIFAAFALLLLYFSPWSGWLHFSADSMLWGMLVLITAIVLKFFIAMAISYLAFWYEETWTFHVIMDISLWFLSGTLMPLSALPEWGRALSAIMPFQYFAYIPSALASGTLPASAGPLYVVKACLWCAGGWLCVRLLWLAGIRKFGAYGG